MRKLALSLSLICLAGAMLASGAWAKGEVRAYLGTATTAINTDNTFQWNQCTTRSANVCSACGYSTDDTTLTNCPNPWGVAGHPAGTMHVVQRLSDRIFGISATDTQSLTIGDWVYTDAGGGTHGRFYIGRPLHPGTHTHYDDALTAADGNSVLRMAASNLLGLPSSGVAGTTSAGDYARFHVLEPGASYPAAYATRSTDNIAGHAPRNIVVPLDADYIGWIVAGAGSAGVNGTYKPMYYDANNKMVYGNANGFKLWWDAATSHWAISTQVGNAQAAWYYQGADGQTALPANAWQLAANGSAAAPTVAQDTVAPRTSNPDNWQVHVNPRLASDGDQWTILQAEEYGPRQGGTPAYRVVIMVYSRLYGWDFYFDTSQDAGADPNLMWGMNSWNIVTNSGALRIECPRMMPDRNTADPTSQEGYFFTRRINFTISANGSLLPRPSDMMAPVDFQTPTGTTGQNDETPDPIYGTWKEARQIAAPTDTPTADDGTGTLRPTWFAYLGPATGTANWGKAWSTRPAWALDGNGRVRSDATLLSLTPAPTVSPAPTTPVASQPTPLPILAGRVGRGQISAQWRRAATNNLNGAGAISAVYDAANTNVGIYRPGGEWEYDDLAAGARTVANANTAQAAVDAATVTRPFETAGNVVAARPTLTSFISSRLQIPLNGNTWQHSTGSTPIATEVANSHTPRYVLGSYAAGNVTNPEFVPGTSTPARQIGVINAALPDRDSAGNPQFLMRCPLENGGCGALFVTSAVAGQVCPYDGAALVQVPTDPANGDYAFTDGRVAALCGRVANSLTTVPGAIEPSHSRRYTLPDYSIKFGPDDLFPLSDLDEMSRAGGALLQPSSINADSTRATSVINARADIPKYQPPSVPAFNAANRPWENDFDNDQGYNGSVMIWNDLSANASMGHSLVVTDDTKLPSPGNPPGFTDTWFQPPVDPAHPHAHDGAVLGSLPYGPPYGPNQTWGGGNTPGIDRFAQNGKWDQYYRCPDCGRLHPPVYYNGVTGAATPPHAPALCETYNWVATGPNTGQYQLSTACKGHWTCPVCGNSYTNAQIAKAYADSGSTSNVRRCPFDGFAFYTGATNPQDTVSPYHISPNKLTEDDLDAEEFDTFDLQVSVSRKVEMVASQAAVDLGRVSPGVNDSAPDTTTGTTGTGKPFGSDVSLPAPSAVSNESNVLVPSWLSPGGVGDPLLTRFDFDSHSYSRERLVGLMPMSAGAWGGILNPYLPGGSLVPLNTLWTLPAQTPGEPNGAAQWMAWRAGIRNATSTKPVPMGQPVGSYSGQQTIFVDTLNNGGVLRFWQRSTGTFTDASASVFDPDNDVPLEPTSVYSLHTRVAEGRLPHNDYYSMDGSPTARIDYDAATGNPSKLQVVWGTNRASLATPATAVTPGAPAPPSSSGAGIAQPTWPVNLVYANATPVDPALTTTDPFYRGYQWSAGEAGTVTNTSIGVDPNAAGTANTGAHTYVDGTGNSWLVWHQQLNHAGGSQSSLQFLGSGWTAPKFIYATGLPKEHIRAYVEASTGAHWLFWDSGTSTERGLWYRWRFDPTATTVDKQELPLPVYNSTPSSVRTDVAVDLAGRSVKKPSHSPFVYTKTPFPMEMNVAGTPVVSCFFAGYARSTQSSDICWTQFDEAALATPTAWRTNNYGKLPFTRISNNSSLPAIGANTWPGEELKGDGLRQAYSSRHLDWMVHDAGTGAAGSDFGRYSASASFNPTLYIGIVRDTPSDGNPPVAQMYRLDWGSAATTQDAYNRARGVYQVTPVLTPLNGAPALPTACVLPGGQLLDRNAKAAGQDLPVKVDIDPASGTLRFTTPLFNVDSPADPSCVFNTSLAQCTDIVDVLAYADYEPYVYRVTNAGGDDDCPNVFWEGGPAQRLVLFWRRNFSAAQSPHYGRSSIMYKVRGLGVALRNPPVRTLNGVTDEAGTSYTPVSSDLVNGVFQFARTDEGRVLRFDYTSDSAQSGGQHCEWHQVPGWSKDTPVPINSVTAEGPLTVVPENYRYQVGGGGNTYSSSRYWLFWASPRSIYDLRAAASNGQAVHQSSDIYSATVAPPPYNLPREVETGSINHSPT